MKKTFFLLAFGVLLLTSSFAVFAMEKNDQSEEEIVNGEVVDEEEVKEYDSPAYAYVFPDNVIFKRKSSSITSSGTRFSLFRDKHFSINKNHRCSELSFDASDYDALRKEGWYIFESRYDLDLAIRDQFSHEAQQAAFDQGKAASAQEILKLKADMEASRKVEEARAKRILEVKDEAHNKGINEGRRQHEAEMSFFERHPKKLILGAIVLTGLSVKAADYWFANRK